MNIKTIFSISIMMLVARFSLMIFNLIIVRFLEIEDYGRLTYADTILGFVIVLSGLGMHTIGIKEISQNKNKFVDIFTNIMTARILTTMVLSLLSVFLFLEKGYTLEFLLYNTAFIFLQILLIDWFLVAMDMKKVLFISLISGVLIQYIVFYYFYHIDNINIENIRISQLFGTLITTSVMFIFTLKFYNLSLLSYCKIKDYLKKSLPLLGSYAFQQTYYAGIPIAISNYLGFYEAGIYGVATRLALVLVTVRNIILQPLSREFYKYSIKEYIKYIKKYLLYISPVLLLLYITLYVFSYEILELFYGKQYTDILVIEIFRIAMFLPIIYFIFIGHTTILILYNKQKYYLFASFISAVIFILIILISKLNLVEYISLFIVLELMIFIFLHYFIIKDKNEKKI